MAVNIPGLSLSILRQETTVRAGKPLLISGRFTAFGLGMPAFIRAYLEGPSYDPQVRSFDTFASPFTGDYTINVLAEKDGYYTVYSQAFPPPLIPTGPPFPEALMLTPPMAESTRPPLAVGVPVTGGVDALMPDGTTKFLSTPPQQPIEFRPLITVGAPGVTVSIPGAAPTVPVFPWMPTPAPPAPPVPAPPAPPVPLPAVGRAFIEDISFWPPEINPGMEATGTASWRNTGDTTKSFDLAFYLVDLLGVQYGPLQTVQAVSATPQVPVRTDVRLSTEGLPSGIYIVLGEIYDAEVGGQVTSGAFPGRLLIREIAPPEPPVPLVPELPTAEMIGEPSLNVPGQVAVGDIWSGSITVPTFGAVPYFFDTSVVLVDPQGFEVPVAQLAQEIPSGGIIEVPINFNTAEYAPGDYGILLRVLDVSGVQLMEFPMGFLSMLAALPPPLPPEVPLEVPLPTADMFGIPILNVPNQLVHGEIWQGSISIPTVAPPELTAALAQVPAVPGMPAMPMALPSFPVNLKLQLETPARQLIDVGTFSPTFTPGEPINVPLSFDTSVLPEPGMHNIVMGITDLQGNQLFSNIIGFLDVLAAAIPPVPPMPPMPPMPPVPSEYTAMFVEMGIQEVEVGDEVTVPFAFTHMGGPEVVIARAAIGSELARVFDEVWWAEKSISVPADPVPTPRRDSITIRITAKLAAAGIYDVYAKIKGELPLDIPKAISPTVPNIVRVFGVPILPTLPTDIQNFDLQVPQGTYNLGDTVAYTAPYQYRGKAQDGWLTISLGTGVAPSFFTSHTFPRIPVTFREAYDWKSDQLSGSFELPALVKGQTYSVRARLETADGKQETDTDWGVIKIEEVARIETLEVRIDPSGAGYVTTSPTGEGVQHNWQFPYGTTVQVTAHPASGYVFRSWSGEMRDTTAITASVYPMTEHRRITAHFEREEVPPPPPPPPAPPEERYRLSLASEPFVGGYIEDVPDKPDYAYGEVVKLTAHAYDGYKFDHWTFDGKWAGTRSPLNLMMTRTGRVTAHFISVPPVLEMGPGL